MNWITYWIDHASKLGSKLKIFNTGAIPNKKESCKNCGMKFNDHLNEGGFEYCPQVKKSEETTINKTSRPLPPPIKKKSILFWLIQYSHLFDDDLKPVDFNLYLMKKCTAFEISEFEFNYHFNFWKQSEVKKQKEEKRKIHFENFGITGCAVDDFKGWLTWNNISESSINSSVVCLYNTQKEKERKAQQETINEIKLKDYFDSLKKKGMCVDIPPSRPGDIKKTWLIYSDDVETMNAARNPKVNFAVWMECRRMQQDKTCTFDTQTTINLLKAMDLDPALYPTTSNQPIQERSQPINDNSTNV